MDALKLMLEKKRKVAAEEFKGQKFIRTGDLEQRKVDKLREEERQEREKKAAKQSSSGLQSTGDGGVSQGSTPLTRGTVGSVKGSHGTAGSQKGEANPAEDAIDNLLLPKVEVIRRLRVLKQPITLYGESDDDRLERLKIVMKTGEVEAEQDLLEGEQNDFLRDIIEMKKGKDKAAPKPQEGGEKGAGQNDKDDDDDNDIDAKRLKANFDELCDEDKILVFFKRLLKEWGREVEERPEAESRSMKAKSVNATYRQCSRYLDPMFKMCRRKVRLYSHPSSTCNAYRIVHIACCVDLCTHTHPPPS